MTCAIPDLKVDVSIENPPTVKLTGQVGFHNRERMSEAFERCLSAGHQLVKADLGDVHYMDTSGISALIQCAYKAVDRGAAIELIGASEQVSRVLTMCGAAVYFNSAVNDMPVSGGPESTDDDRGFWHISDFSIPACPQTAGIARSRIENVVESMPFSRSEAQDILIAVGEAIANAIRHGCLCNPELRISIKCVAGPQGLSIDITDPGAGFLPDTIPEHKPNSLLEGGMGIYMMRMLVDEVTFKFDGTTTVRLIKHVNKPALARS
ncbi:MAG: ATP-binding protein [Armatimonadota bacterium]